MRPLCPTRHGRSLLVGSILIAALCVLGPPTAAFAGGSGYGPVYPSPPGGSGGFSTVVATQTVPSSGGVVTGSAYGGTATVTVPAGSLRHGGQVVITADQPCTIDAGKRLAAVADFGVAILNSRNGKTLRRPFNPAINLTINDSSITSGDSVVIVTAPGQVWWVPGAQVTTGQAVVTFAHDADFTVVSTGAPAGCHPTTHRPPHRHRGGVS
jgi:hypothetical protein